MSRIKENNLSIHIFDPCAAMPDKIFKPIECIFIYLLSAYFTKKVSKFIKTDHVPLLSTWKYFSSPPVKRCFPGYYGRGCYESCRYPSFGNQCKGECRCKPNLCHFKTGCPTLGKNQ